MVERKVYSIDMEISCHHFVHYKNETEQRQSMIDDKKSLDSIALK